MCTKQHDLRGDEEIVSSLHQDDNVTNHGRLHAHLLTEPREQVRAKSYSFPNTMEFSIIAFTSLGGSLFCWLQQSQLCSCSHQLTSPLAFIRLTKVRHLGLWNDNKDKSGMWSEVMGLCVCKAARKSSFRRSQKVKRSVAALCLQTKSEPVCRLANKQTRPPTIETAVT